jgi:hypothetical protein
MNSKRGKWRYVALAIMAVLGLTFFLLQSPLFYKTETVQQAKVEI